MWLTCSSIGRKLVMAVTGVCLVLFVTFHCLMNGVALFWPEAYNDVCAFLGANWYALIASIGLAALFIIHIIYAVWLTLQNRKARGSSRYAVTSRPVQVEWASKNMLVLGIVVAVVMAVLGNLVVTPAWLGVPVDAVVAMIVPILIPFNLAKGILNSVLTLIVYKAISNLITPKKDQVKGF